MKCVGENAMAFDKTRKMSDKSKDLNSPKLTDSSGIYVSSSIHTL